MSEEEGLNEDIPRDFALQCYAIATVHLDAMRYAVVERRYRDAANDLALAMVQLARLPAHLVSAMEARLRP